MRAVIQGHILEILLSQKDHTRPNVCILIKYINSVLSGFS